MGKSPGKWIKSILFGKKTLKASHIRHKEIPGRLKVVNGHANAPENPPTFIPPVGWKCVEDENGLCCSLDLGKLNLGSESSKDLAEQQNERIQESGHQGDEAEQEVVSEAPMDPERSKQENAATKVQAAFRGYLARHAFRALKGVIRLQAFIRGHLVRRQAVSTLYCVIGIVKLQAMVRGSRVRCGNIGVEVKKICTLVMPQHNKLEGSAGGDVWKKTAMSSGNAFVRKVLAPSPKVMPLLIEYESADLNSHVNWLERWSMSCPWKPAPSIKKPIYQQSQKLQERLPAVENASGKPKKSVRKVHSNIDSASSQVANDFEKPRRSLKKVTSNSAESLQENPRIELEKIKCNLRKVQNPVIESAIQPQEVNEILNQNRGESLAESVVQPKVSLERPNENQGNSSDSNGHDVLVPNDVSKSEEVKDESTIFVNEGSPAGSEPEEAESFKPNDTVESSSTSDQTAVTTHLPQSNGKDENVPPSNEKLKSKNDSPLVKYQKPARRPSYLVKRDRRETLDDGVQNTLKLPSYMAATESAKAKLRGLGASPRLSQDSADKNINTRRHSLPYANGKSNSPSPRTPKPAQACGKGSNKKDRSLLPSIAANGKPVQVEWRR